MVWVRGRVHNSRVKGKVGFLVLREKLSTIQCALFVGGEGVDEISKGMVNWVGKIPKESIIEIKARVVAP